MAVTMGKDDQDVDNEKWPLKCRLRAELFIDILFEIKMNYSQGTISNSEVFTIMKTGNKTQKRTWIADNSASPIRGLQRLSLA